MKIGGIIRGWYEKNRRELPMRQTRDPYKIWVSEIIFQQTRINQGLHYYLNFLSTFPDLSALARASEDEVLKSWQGLGYYNRARNLQSSAKYIMEHKEGRIPGSYEEWIALKGVGKYTAAAIASICFGEARAAVDGNVSRLIARLYGVNTPISSSAGSRMIDSLANELLDRDDPGEHNQAMIDFGALVCVPRSPDCTVCPLKDRCVAWNNGEVDRIPVKRPKRKPVDRWMYFYIIVYKGHTLLMKRDDKNIWKSLYHFPMVESETPCEEEEIVGDMWKKLMPYDLHVTIRHLSSPIIHQLSHLTLHALFIHVELGNRPREWPGGWIEISPDQIDDYPVPRLINRYMEVVKI